MDYTMERGSGDMMSEKYVIFGAGKMGRDALKKYGNENISYFIDNAVFGHMVEGLEVKDLEYYKNDTRSFKIIIAAARWMEIVEQLDKNNIKDYIIYIQKFKSYFSEDILIYNQYENRNAFSTEEDYNQTTIQQKRYLLVKSRVEELSRNLQLFNHIEIETYNRCNGVCDFCPVSVQWESRPKQKMEIGLFYKIIDELSELDYSGRLALFSNNEPLLDDRILEMRSYARRKVPKARMHLYTNGTLLTLEKFIKLMEYLDELIIDNYNQELKLIPNVEKIKGYCEEHPELIKKVTISLRKPKEVLATRGGDAPNRKNQISYKNTTCVNPFVQMIVRPDGKVSLCCNDPLGRNTLGDLKKNSLTDVWYGEEFMKVRAAIEKGRQFWPHCEYCDVFNID